MYYHVTTIENAALIEWVNWLGENSKGDCVCIEMLPK